MKKGARIPPQLVSGSSGSSLPRRRGTTVPKETSGKKVLKKASGKKVLKKTSEKKVREDQSEREKEVSEKVSVEGTYEGASSSARQSRGVTESATQNSQQNDSRYILFVGGLPYHSTQFDVKQFFGKKVGRDIEGVRLLTEKGSNKPKGCAFVEFLSKESFSKALGFHGRELEGRKIRIEMTVGGGGKAASRQAKLKAKKRTLQRLRKRKIRSSIHKRNGAESEVAVQDDI